MKFDYKAAEAELRRMVAVERNSILSINGRVVAIVLGGYVAASIVEEASFRMEDHGETAEQALDFVAADLADERWEFRGIISLINDSGPVLAPNQPAEGSILAKYDGRCDRSGWPVIAGVHYIVPFGRGWARTDQV
jgi:hypothetical protein